MIVFIEGERVVFRKTDGTPAALHRYEGEQGTIQRVHTGPDIPVKFDIDGKTIPCLPYELEAVR